MTSTVRTRLLVALAFTFVTVLAGCGAGGSAHTQSEPTGVGPATLALNNLSNETVYQVFMSPTAQNTWGPDLLGAHVLHVGQAFTLSNITPGTWDIRVVDASGNYKQWFGEYLGAGGSYRIDVSSGGWTR